MKGKILIFLTIVVPTTILSNMRLLLLSFCFLLSFSGRSTQLLIPMDDSQTDHLKAYGIAFYCLERNVTVEWLLNYRGGSFLVPHLKTLEEELIIRGVSYEIR